MGRSRQSRPERLPEKLRGIRVMLGLTQQELHERLNNAGNVTLHVGYIGSYETGDKVPSLQIVLLYSRLAGIPMEILVDDELGLPQKLPQR